MTFSQSLFTVATTNFLSKLYWLQTNKLPSATIPLLFACFIFLRGISIFSHFACYLLFIFGGYSVILWSASGEPGGTSPPGIRRSTPPGFICWTIWQVSNYASATILFLLACFVRVLQTFFSVVSVFSLTLRVLCSYARHLTGWKLITF